MSSAVQLNLKQAYFGPTLGLSCSCSKTGWGRLRNAGQIEVLSSPWTTQQCLQGSRCLVRAQVGPGSKGFGQKSTKVRRNERGSAPSKYNVDPISLARKLQGGSKDLQVRDTEAPSVSGSSRFADKDKSFDQRLQALRSSVPEKVRDKGKDAFSPIDYDAADEEAPKESSNQLWIKIVAGVGTVLLLGVFASSDLVLGNSSSSGSKEVVAPQLSVEEADKLKEQATSFEAKLATEPKDVNALEGAAVSYAELGDFSKAASYLEQLVKVRPNDYEALRVLGETRTALGQLDKAAIAYRRAIKEAPIESVGLLKGLADVLISDGKPGEAVSELLKARERIAAGAAASTSEAAPADETNGEGADPVQVELLLGKSYSAWGRVGDAFAVYNGLIERDPKDFRGYLAKGVLLKEQGQRGEADRMFVQAKYLAPESAKRVVDLVVSRK